MFCKFNDFNLKQTTGNVWSIVLMHRRLCTKIAQAHKHTICKGGAFLSRDHKLADIPGLDWGVGSLSTRRRGISHPRQSYGLSVTFCIYFRESWYICAPLVSRGRMWTSMQCKFIPSFVCFFSPSLSHPLALISSCASVILRSQPEISWYAV